MCTKLNYAVNDFCIDMHKTVIRKALEFGLGTDLILQEETDQSQELLLQCQAENILHSEELLKGNMHQSDNVGLKDAHYIIDMAAGFHFEKISTVS